MKKILFILFCSLNILAFSQSKMVWLKTADERFEMKDYQNALIYYKKVLNDTIALSTQILPYEVQLSNRDLSKKKQERNGKKVTLEEYVEHQIGMCYKHTFDYHRAEKQFEKTQHLEGYPTDAFYYGNALKKMGKLNQLLMLLRCLYVLLLILTP
ncbi:hypothetical protein [Brumimicrobium salinarum]|nr:hypothetical protein [Brumimicrobium salinarum]